MTPRRSLVGLGLFLCLSACAGRQTAKTKPAEIITLSAATVTARPLAGALTASGAFVARQEAGVSSELAGYRIDEVLADEDQWVAKDQPLVRLDDALLRSQIAQSQANLVMQEVAGQRAAAEADRVKGLEGMGVISDEQIAERRLAAKAAQAQVQLARAQLQDLKTRDARLVLRAPAAGRILERNVRPGDTSSPAVTLYRIAVDGVVELDAEVSQADLGDVRPGEAVEVALPSGPRLWGHVRFVSPRVDAQTGLGHVRISLPTREDLRPGAFGRAIFAGGGRPAPSVPEAAIHFDAAGPSVMVIGEGDKVHRVPIRTGRRAGGYVELLEGPPVGARVALGGGAFVLDGDVVRVAASSAAEPGA